MAEAKNTLPRLHVLVEGESDRHILEHIFRSAKLRDIPIQFESCGGQDALRVAAHELERVATTIALVDADLPSIPDSVTWARQILGDPPIPVYCAVPTIEAWIFADKELAKRNSLGTSYSKSSINRIITPESLTSPKILARQVFPKAAIEAHYPFLGEIDIGIATGRSASLMAFIRGIFDALALPSSFIDQVIVDSLNRVVFANLLRELPASTIGWRTLDGEYSAETLAEMIHQGNPVGLRYISELLRLARDILAARNVQDTDA